MDGRRRHRTASIVVALAVAITACGGDGQPGGQVAVPPSDPVDVTPSEPVVPPRLPQAESPSNGGPPRPYVSRGACPFECCVYGDWEAVTTIPVYAAEGDTSAVAFQLEAGEGFTAVTGNVHIRTPGVAIALDTVSAGDPIGTTRFEPGDTVYILDHLGEGTYNLWHDGEVVFGEGFWMVMPLSGRGTLGRLVNEPESDWWVQVRDGSGRTGWIDMDRAGQRVSGSDACS